MQENQQTCPVIGYQKASICVPVTVKPFAEAETPQTKCCGTAVITSGTDVCGGTANGECVFTISQDICMAIPVNFGATAQVGTTYVSCIEASNKNICTDCGNEQSDSVSN